MMTSASPDMEVISPFSLMVSRPPLSAGSTSLLDVADGEAGLPLLAILGIIALVANMVFNLMLVWHFRHMGLALATAHQPGLILLDLALRGRRN